MVPSSLTSLVGMSGMFSMRQMAPAAAFSSAPEHRFGDILTSLDLPREHSGDSRSTVIRPKSLCDPVCFLVHFRQPHGEALARIRWFEAHYSLSLALPSVSNYLVGPLCPPVLSAEFRLGTDMLQLGFPGVDSLSLGEE